MKFLPTIIIFILCTFGINAYGEIIFYQTDITAPQFDRGQGFNQNHKFVDFQPGAPMMPYENYQILLPFGEKIDELSVNLIGKKQLSGEFDIPHAPQPTEMGTLAKATPKNLTIYNGQNPYPSQDYELIGVQRLGGMDVAIINVFPYKYFPTSKKLEYYSSIQINISTIPNAQIQEEQSKKICKSDGIIDRLTKLIVNPEKIQSYPDENTYWGNRNLILPDDPHEFIIITGEEYLDIFTDYASWKEEHDVSAAVFAIEDILTEYSDGNDDADNLRNFIIDAYQTWANTSHPLEYVLLAGDDEIIPVRFCWGNFGAGIQLLPCDMYFGTLDGNWNSDGDGYYGEANDNPDLYAEVHVGRFTGDNLSDFQNMIHKTKTYVDFPSDYLDHSTMVGEQLTDNAPIEWGGTFKDHIALDPTKMPSYYDVSTLYDRDNTFSDEIIIEHINNNQTSLINHAGRCLGGEVLMSLDRNQIDDLENTSFPFLYSQG